jgi:hypothetical protein
MISCKAMTLKGDWVIAFQQINYLYLLSASLGYFFHRNFNLSIGILHIIKSSHQWLYEEDKLV